MDAATSAAWRTRVADYFRRQAHWHDRTHDQCADGLRRVAVHVGGLPLDDGRLKGLADMDAEGRLGAKLNVGGRFDALHAQFGLHPRVEDPDEFLTRFVDGD